MNGSHMIVILSRSNKKSITFVLLFIGIWSLFLSVPTQIMAQSLDEARRLNTQAVELYEQGRYGEAIGVAEKALVIYEKVLGKEHSLTGASYNILGLLYNLLGDYARAEPLLQKVPYVKERNVVPRPFRALRMSIISLFYFWKLFNLGLKCRHFF